jgi:hypothetical protein
VGALAHELIVTILLGSLHVHTVRVDMNVW